MANEDTLDKARLAAEYGFLPTLLLAAGHKYETGALFEGVADTNTKTIVLENTSATRVAFLLEPTTSASGQYFVDKVKDPTIDTEGDAAPLVNNKTDEPDANGIVARTAGDNETGAISGGTPYPRLTAGSGSNASNAGAGVSGRSGAVDLVMPGDTIAIQVQNQSGSTQDLSIVTSYLTLPESELNDLRF
jgi:hypothetical protein